MRSITDAIQSINYQLVKDMSTLNVGSNPLHPFLKNRRQCFSLVTEEKESNSVKCNAAHTWKYFRVCGSREIIVILLTQLINDGTQEEIHMDISIKFKGKWLWHQLRDEQFNTENRTPKKQGYLLCSCYNNFRRKWEGIDIIFYVELEFVIQTVIEKH